MDILLKHLNFVLFKKLFKIVNINKKCKNFVALSSNLPQVLSCTEEGMRLGVRGFMFWQILPSISLYACFSEGFGLYVFIYIYMHNKFITSWTSLLNILLINIADKFIVLGTLNTETSENISHISVTHKVLKSCRNKMATWAYDVCDVHEASLLYIKTCWQSSFIYVYV